MRKTAIAARISENLEGDDGGIIAPAFTGTTPLRLL